MKFSFRHRATNEGVFMAQFYFFYIYRACLTPPFHYDVCVTVTLLMCVSMTLFVSVCTAVTLQ